MTNDELSRLREAFAAPEVSAKGAPEPEACPPSDQIWLAVRGELPPDELRAILDHIAACPACAEDWRIAMVFEEEARAAAPPRRIHTDRRAWMAVAATILVAVVGFQLQRPKEDPATVFRGDGPAGVQSLVEGESLPREAFLLEWQAVPGAEAYRVEVTTTSGLDPLFQADRLTTTSCQVPAGALAGVRSGDTIYWTVTPVGQGGGRLPPRTFKTRVE